MEGWHKTIYKKQRDYGCRLYKEATETECKRDDKGGIFGQGVPRHGGAYRCPCRRDFENLLGIAGRCADGAPRYGGLRRLTFGGGGDLVG